MSQVVHWSSCILGNGLVVSEVQGPSCDPRGCLVCSCYWNHVGESDLQLRTKEIKQRARTPLLSQVPSQKKDISAVSLKHKPVSLMLGLHSSYHLAGFCLEIALATYLTAEPVSVSLEALDMN